MEFISQRVSSNQNDVHPQLAATVLKHLEHSFHKPPAAHTLAAFAQLIKQQADRPPAVIFDSCCGTGWSSFQLAERYPEAWVIGMDRSIDRLQRALSAPPPNLTLIQADCVDLWRLTEQAGWRLQAHYLLYPNPYPKAAQLKRRWHGHPVFASLLALGGTLEVRSNWRIYIEEFRQALILAGKSAQADMPFTPDQYLTLFEKKYALSGHELYRCKATLG